MRQFLHQRLNLGLCGVEFRLPLRQPSRGIGGVLLRLVEQALHGTQDPLRKLRVGVSACQFGVQVHARIVVIGIP